MMITIKCAECATSKEIYPSGLNVLGNNFCSRSCSVRYNNRGKTRSVETKRKISSKLAGNKLSDITRAKISASIKKITYDPSYTIPPRKSGSKRIKRQFVSKCIICNNEILSRRLTCSKECFIARQRQTGRKAGQASARSRPRRSKDEIKLFDLIQKHYPTITHNEPIVNGWDADIIIRELKIAILWNGIWHREQLSFSNHSLKQVQTRDRIKIRELTDTGWKVIVYEDNEWTPETAFKDFMDNIWISG